MHFLLHAMDDRKSGKARIETEKIGRIGENGGKLPEKFHLSLWQFEILKITFLLLNTPSQATPNLEWLTCIRWAVAIKTAEFSYQILPGTRTELGLRSPRLPLHR